MLRVLIVEDNRNFREIFRNQLYEYFPSIVIEEAENGEEAWQKMKGTPSHLIYMDIRLPGLDGLQLTHRIKTNYPDTKVIIMTAYGVPEYREAATRCGASCFLPKDSLNLGQVETLVKSVLSGLNKPY